MNAVQLVLALAGGSLITALVALYQARATRAKTVAETSKTGIDASANALKAITEATSILYEPMTKQMFAMTERLAVLEAEIERLQQLVRELQ